MSAFTKQTSSVRASSWPFRRTSSSRGAPEGLASTFGMWRAPTSAAISAGVGAEQDDVGARGERGPAADGVALNEAEEAVEALRDREDGEGRCHAMVAAL